MTTYYSGSLKIEIEPDGTTHDNRERFKGAVILPDGRRWEFDDLASGVGGCRHGEISMAESALSFASYYTSGNRGDDLPEWAPPAEVADAIEQAADYTPEGRAGEVSEDGHAYLGDSFAVFDSPEAQARWYKEING